MSYDRDHEEEERPRKKAGMSTTLKVLLILGGLGFVSMVVCCGAGVWFVGRSVVTDAAAVNGLRDKIVGMEIPAGFKPVFGMNIVFQMAVYVGDKEAMLLIMQMPGEVDGKDMQRGMEQQMEKQGKNTSIKIESKETRDIDIDGKPVPFTFAKGKREQDGVEVRSITGTFPGRGGTACLMITIPESDYDEEAVTNTLKSIHK